MRGAESPPESAVRMKGGAGEGWPLSLPDSPPLQPQLQERLAAGAGGSALLADTRAHRGSSRDPARGRAKAKDRALLREPRAEGPPAKKSRSVRAKAQPKAKAQPTLPCLAKVREPVGGREYSLEAKIGEGTYGLVYTGKCLASGRGVAVKRFRLDEEEGVPATTLREVSILQACRHPNIVALRDHFLASERFYIVMELLETDLGAYLQERKSRAEAVSLGQLQSLLWQTCAGLHFLHSHGMVHRDIKPQNLLLNRAQGTLKIGDLGLGRRMPIQESPKTPEVVTIWYRCPELMLGDVCYTESLDMWSVGCVLGELSTGAALFPGDSEISQLFLIFQLLGTPTEASWSGVERMSAYHVEWPKWGRASLASRFERLGLAGADLLAGLLRYEKRERLTAADALRHAFFDDVRTLPLDPLASPTANGPPALALHPPQPLHTPSTDEIVRELTADASFI